VRTVLVVEDEPLIRLLLTEAIEGAGFSVIEAGTADEALDIISDQAINVLFTDIQMPGEVSGLDLAHVVAACFPQAGILIASGRLTPDDISLPPSAEFFAKPYDLDQIIDRLERL
jgi:two-component system, cell cycle response regulator CpdR